MNFEKIGQFVGETVGKKTVHFLERRVDNFDLSVGGIENLAEMKDEPFMLVSNHIKPIEKPAQNSGISPDAFILSKLADETIGKKLKIVRKSDDGWQAKSSLMQKFQKNISQPFGRGLSKGAGTIPVEKNPGSLNRDFLKTVDETLENGDPILIFPEGTWYDDFSTEHPIDPGAAHLAKKHSLKIIPAYINGANSWEENTKSQVVFGKFFTVESLSKDEISEKIKKEIANLQESLT